MPWQCPCHLGISMGNTLEKKEKEIGWGAAPWQCPLNQPYNTERAKNGGSAEQFGHDIHTA